MRKPFSIWLALVATLVGIGGCASSQSPATQQTAVFATGTVDAFYAEQSANSVAFDLKFQGKRVEVSGIVSYVSLDSKGNPSVDLKGEDIGTGYFKMSSIYTVTAYLEKSQANKVAQLSDNQRITVAGILQKNTFGELELRSASIKTPSATVTRPSPTINSPASQIPNTLAVTPIVTITVEDLVKAYIDNEVAANSKYKGKQVRVSGYARQVYTDRYTGNPSIYLIDDFHRGAYVESTPFGVVATFDKSKASEVATLSLSEGYPRVTFIGVCDGLSSQGNVAMSSASNLSVIR